MVTFLLDMGREDELRWMPGWKAPPLTGDRKVTWSLLVTKNWRMTFRISQDEIEIIEPGRRRLPPGCGHERYFWFPHEEPVHP